MAPDTNAGGGDDARIRRLEEKFEQLQAAQSSTKLTGRILTAVFAAVVLFAGYRMVEPVIEIANNPKPFTDRIAEDMQRNVFPRLQSEGEALIKEDLLPYAEKELKAHIEKRIPEITAKIESEGGQLIADLTTLIEVRLKERAGNFQAKYYEIFAERFPDLADEQKATVIMNNLQIALDNVGERILGDYLHEHREAITRMSLSFDKMRVPDNLKAMTNTQLLDHTLAAFADVLATWFQLTPELVAGEPAPIR